MHWTEPSTTPNPNREARRFRVTHVFHPQFGHEFDLFQYRQCWGEDRVFFYLNEGEALRSMPARWTSAATDDVFVVISAGRSLYRVADLLDLAKQIRGVQP